MGLVAPKQSFVELLVIRPAVDVPSRVALGPTYHPSKQVSQQPGPPQAPPSRLQLGALQTFPRASVRRPPSGSVLGSPRPRPAPAPLSHAPTPTGPHWPRQVLFLQGVSRFPPHLIEYYSAYTSVVHAANTLRGWAQ